MSNPTVSSSPLDSKLWWPIVFESHTFPPTLMGISILTSLPGHLTPSAERWILELAACAEVRRKAPAKDCETHARDAMDFMLDHRAAVLEAITKNLGTYGFEAPTTYRDWMMALQAIAETAAASKGDCYWAAPPPEGQVGKARENAARLESFLDGLGK